MKTKYFGDSNAPDANGGALQRIEVDVQCCKSSVHSNEVVSKPGYCSGKGFRVHENKDRVLYKMSRVYIVHSSESRLIFPRLIKSCYTQRPPGLCETLRTFSQTPQLHFLMATSCTS